jgi:hypothetical protein
VLPFLHFWIYKLVEKGRILSGFYSFYNDELWCRNSNFGEFFSWRFNKNRQVTALLTVWLAPKNLLKTAAMHLLQWHVGNAKMLLSLFLLYLGVYRNGSQRIEKRLFA